MTPEFKEAARNCPFVKILHEAGKTPDEIILMLVKLKNRLLQDVNELKLLTPKRVRMSDGSERIWRCPEELIPVEEFSPMDIGDSLWELPHRDDQTEGNKQGVNNLC